MYAVFEDVEQFEVHKKKSNHVPPHVHNAVELVFVTHGTQEVGIGQELYHMDEGDVAVIFPDLIHHYQVFGKGKNRQIVVLAAPVLAGTYLSTLRQQAPETPVIKAENVHPDVIYAFERLAQMKVARTTSARNWDRPADSKKKEAKKPAVTDPNDEVVHQAFLQLILARLLPKLTLVERKEMENNDLIFRAVSYIAQHFTEEISLTSMATDLYVSPYALSRIFSGTFHTNFNQYLNNTRLQYVTYLLKYTNQSITEAYENAGFESQRTFNRVFKESYHMSPRDFRDRAKEELLDEGKLDAEEEEALKTPMMIV